MLKKTDDLLAESKAKIGEKETEELTELQKERSLELEKAAKEINEKFDELENEVKERCKSYREEREQIFGEKKLNLEEKLALLNQAARVNRKLIDTQGERAAEELADASSDSEGRIRRLENFTTTVSSILAAEDDWTDCQCLPDVSSASGLLEEEVKKELLEWDTIPVIDTHELPPIVDKVTIAQNPESVIEIDEIKHEDGFVMTTTADARDRIVISGKASRTHAFVTAVDTNGKLLWQRSIENTDKTLGKPKCYSAAISKQLMVNACTFNEVSICHFHDGYVSSTHDFRDEATNGMDITNDWGEKKLITCVTCDPANKDVFLGSYTRRYGMSKEMLVLNDKLKYKHTIDLPDDICWARDITFHRGHLIVCDYDGKAGYMISVDKPNTRIVHRFTKPTHEDGDWYPTRVCTDSKECIYIMWEGKVDNKGKRILTQYSPDSYQLLMTKAVDDFARALTTTFINGREKLLVTTTTTGKMYIYDLVTG